MSPYSIAADDKSLSAQTSGPMADTAARLLQTLAARRPLIVALGGAPGTGKSTLARACAARCDNPVVLSLDDYYLPRADRLKLAQTVHPMLSTRGVPGTHDIELLCAHLDLLKQAQHEPIETPLFDKQVDDRSRETRVIASGARDRLIFLEGWIIGVTPQDEIELARPVNDLEAEQDVDGRWRLWVNQQLQRYSEKLRRFIDTRWMLLAPDWETIIDWRWQQEQQHEPRWLDSRLEVAAFLAPYQRLCEHLQQNSHRWADLTIPLDGDHRLAEGLAQ